MQTPNDFIRAKCSLAVTCRNCEHRAFFTGQFLKSRLGMYARVADASFSCGICRSSNVTMAAASEELARKPIDPRMHFAGIYEKLEFDD